MKGARSTALSILRSPRGMRASVTISAAVWHLGGEEESVISSPKSFEHSGLRTSLVQPQVLVKLRGQAGATEAAVRSQRDRAERLHRLGVLVRVEPDMGLL